MDKQGGRVVAPYLEKHPASYTILLDPGLDVARIFAIRGTPTNFLVSRKGEILGGGVGYRDWTTQEAQALIESLF